MAFANPNITAYAVEATEFPDLARRYMVNGVPKTVVNDDDRDSGSHSPGRLRRAGAADPARQRTVKRWLLALALVAAAAAAAPVVPSSAAEPVRYRFSFPEPADRWMQVDATFTELQRGAARVADQPIVARDATRSHDFAKNVYDVHAYAPDGRELRTRAAG